MSKEYGHAGCKDAVWEKADTVKGKNPNMYRADADGHVLYKAAYGTYGEMGWSIDHKVPQSKGGSDKQQNLQAMQSKANSSYGNSSSKPSITKKKK